MKKYIIATIIAFFFLTSEKTFANEFYVITVYHFKDSQEVRLDTYLQTAYIPALHRKGKTEIGVFKPIANDTSADKLIYMIVPYKSFDEIQIIDE